jgi:hypothetical protein
VTINLATIAEIFSGYTFRTQLKADPEGDTHVIQFRDVQDFRQINPSSPVRIKARKIPARHFLTPYDVLFLAKSQYNYAIPYEPTFQQAAASSMFLILRVKDEQLHPHYLAWYLNQNPAQNFLKNRAAGTYIRNIPKKDLGELPVPIPPIDKQKSIVDINRLQNEETRLAREITRKRQQLVQQQLLNSIEES